MTLNILLLMGIIKGKLYVGRSSAAADAAAPLYTGATEVHAGFVVQALNSF